MRGILNSMRYEVPFDHERRGGYHALSNSTVPLADGGALVPFCIPAVSKDYTISTEYLVNIDRYGNIIKRYPVSNPAQQAFLKIETYGEKTVAYNNQDRDIVNVLNSTGQNIVIPCGLYYYECFFDVKNPKEPPRTDPNTDPEPASRHFKTEIFRLDKALTILGGDGDLPVIPTDKGDFSPLDFNIDFYTGT